ncbi:sugar-binding domain-containing protein [Labilibacter marinus]|uniref:sugar-binding domain-containing protein n=1 Tax=Labilibacter marinus TaxID=1477105 RepID=UPI0009500D95|nr:sugar-binding domain-containing protein [Labilibacter marinus]
MKRKYLHIIILVLLYSMEMSGQEYKFVKDLSGKWKFSLGNNPEWSKSNYDDSGWDKIYVPSAWEMQGFNGYDGYAWYRKTITIPQLYNKEALAIELGYIDDVDKVYFNGKKIGKTGDFPPCFATAYNARRIYDIPEYLINYDAPNTIAVQVFDEGLEGGIVRGDIRLIAEKNPLRPFMDLQGDWNFKIGDDLSWRYDTGEDGSWRKIYVPGNWENQGFKDLNGYAWYQTSFIANDSFSKDRIVLLLGKIDDLDEVFINGIKVGQTGFMEPEHRQREHTEAYNQLRGYLIPEGIIQQGKTNTIHVRVSDFYLEGGIYAGPIGFIHQQDYISYWKNRKKSNY